VIGIECFIIYAYLLDFVFKEIYFDVFSFLEVFVAHWTAGYFGKPVIDAFIMENVKTAQHSTLSSIFNSTQTDNTIANKILLTLHSYQNHLNILVKLFRKTFLNLKLCTSNH